jgi:hypothetical protein
MADSRSACTCSAAGIYIVALMHVLCQVRPYQICPRRIASTGASNAPPREHSVVPEAARDSNNDSVHVSIEPAKLRGLDDVCIDGMDFMIGRPSL